MALPHFLIIGAMKSATSTLHDQLSNQPGIFMSTPKEPNFFSDDIHWERGMGWYEGLFSEAGPDDIIGESSTHYTKLPTYPHTVERMKSHLPDVKLIYMMRDPVDRLISHYMHGWLEGTIRGDINEAIRKYPELIDYGRYEMQLEPFRQAYGDERILLLHFDDVRAAPQKLLENVCAFIGYRGQPKWNIDLNQRNISSQRLRDSRVRDAIVLNPLASFIRKRFIPRSVRDHVKSFWQMRQRPVLTDASLAYLKKCFAEGRG